MHRRHLVGILGEKGREEDGGRKSKGGERRRWGSLEGKGVVGGQVGAGEQGQLAEPERENDETLVGFFSFSRVLAFFVRLG